MALLQVETFNEVAPLAAKLSPLFVVTRSEKGSVLIKGKELVQQDAVHVDRVVDSTGAGDAYTAGFLYAYTNGMSLDKCARAGTFCASHVIQQVGARIEKDALGELT